MTGAHLSKSTPPPPGIFFRPWRRGASALALALAPALLLPLGGCAPEWLGDTTTFRDLLLLGGAFLLAQVVLTAVFLPVVLRRWEARSARIRRIDNILDQLAHLRLLDSPSGILRKAGMIRDLNTLGGQPDELEGCLLPGADLRGVWLEGCPMRGADLTGADLQGANLAGVDLFGAELAGANLTFANLAGAVLRGANLEGARLNKADLTGTNLHRATLLDADLSKARLEGAVLDKARFVHGRGDPLRHEIHHSVEDWIRARLDNDGRYRPPSGDRERHPLPSAM